MKILLIQPPWYGFQNIVSRRLCLGLPYLAAVLEKNGHEVVIYNGETAFNQRVGLAEPAVVSSSIYLKSLSPDHEVYQRIVTFVKAFQPDMVGISFATAVSTSAYYLARLLKKYRPDLPLIAGGFHPTVLPHEPLGNGLFDFVVRGEGEDTFRELVTGIDRHEDYTDIQGISFMRDGEVVHNPCRPYIRNIDDIPFPAFHLLHDAKSQLDACVGITAARGCPYQCTYCGSSLMWSRKVRFRSANNVVEEINDRYSRLGLKSFSFEDDTFTLRPAYVWELCEKILDMPFPIQWRCDTRGETLNRDMLKLMRKAGCYMMGVGLESGSPKIQSQIKKNLSTDVIKSAVRMAREADVDTTVYMMAGFPDETEEDLQQSISAVNEIKPDHVTWSIMTPYPGTEIWKIAESRGLVNKDCKWETFFHHFDRGNVFQSLSDESWDKLLSIINKQQYRLNNRMTWKKAKKGLTHPGKILDFLRRRYISFQQGEHKR